MSRLIEIAGPLGAMIVALQERRFFDRLFGTPWKAEPGRVWMATIAADRRGSEWFHYTHWRERSLFRGRVYRIVNKRQT